MKAVQQVCPNSRPCSGYLPRLMANTQLTRSQLLFDVEWRSDSGHGEEDLDVLVIDMPPGTGDVQLSLGQLVDVDGEPNNFAVTPLTCLCRRSDSVHAAGCSADRRT